MKITKQQLVEIIKEELDHNKIPQDLYINTRRDVVAALEKGPWAAQLRTPEIGLPVARALEGVAEAIRENASLPARD